MKTLLAWPMTWRPAVHHDRLERAAGGDQGAAAGPGHDVGRHRLGLGRGIGEREDDRPVGVRGHLADGRFGERARHAARADEHRRLHCRDHGLESEPIAGFSPPKPKAASSSGPRANSRLSSSSSSRSAKTRPFVSTVTMARLAWRRHALRLIAARTVRAIPVPAAPAPRKTKRCSASGRPTARRRPGCRPGPPRRFPGCRR
jgi:hypothetical protein